ncbi:MAG: hypothetical protein DRI81_18320 [Chloroflexi bacterium]|nr:MAG: hypothetical protein DRI81_18320 [Chloroflexota bacterium]
MEMPLFLALIAGAGVFLAFSGMVIPRSVRLARPGKERSPLGRLQARLDAAEMPVSAREFASVYVGVIIVSILLALVLAAPIFVLVGAILGPVLLWQRYEGQRDKFRQAYDDSLAEAVQLLREGFSATGVLRDALDHVVRNGPDPAAVDFREVWAGMSTGKSLAEAFAPVVERRNNAYLRLVAEALTLKAAEGGSARDVLLGLETMIRDQVMLKREVLARQSQARLESTIVSLAPWGFFLSIKLLPWMREYEGGFFSTLLGQLTLVGAAIFSMLSFFMSRRISLRGMSLEVEEVAPA